MKIHIIDIGNPANTEITCCICGKKDFNRWGLPIDQNTALVAPNDYDGDWGCKPACKSCWEVHNTGGLVGHEPFF